MKTYLPGYKSISILFFIVSSLVMAGCGKGNGGPTTPVTPVEANLVFTTNPDPGSTVLAVSSSVQNIAISITSTMPASGVTADVTVKKDSDNSTVFSQSLSSTTAGFTVGIQNIPTGSVCTVSITLTSKSKPSNTASKTFKISRK